MSDSTAVPPSQSLVAGKYQLNGIIGRGGMGSVWEGKHISLGTRVAVKFIEKEYADSAEARNRFHTEARAAATIQSKYAVQIFDHGVTDDGRPYIVMELLEGEGLDKRLERLGRIPLQEVARMIMQVCRALQRAHDGGIIHRDLKVENIFLQRSVDDDDDTAKVLDFGIAKVRNIDGNTLSNSTKTGAVLGTPYYMSPEQARGLRDLDHRSDLWSLGVIAFKCVTGVLPFEGQSLGDLLVKICTAPLPIPSQVLPELPPAFDAWFQRALDREPAARFGSATELADALAFAAGLSVKRSPGSVPRPSGTSERVSPVSPTAASGRTPGPAGFGATSAPLTHTSPGTLKRSNAGAVIGIAAFMLAVGAGGAFYWTTRAKPPTPTPAASVDRAQPPTSAVAPPTPTLTVAAPTAIASIEPVAVTPPIASTGAGTTTSKTRTKTPTKTTTLPKPVEKTTPPEAKTEPKVEPAKVPVQKPPKTGDPGF